MLTVPPQELQSNDLECLKARVTKYVQAFGQLTERLLGGSMIGDPDAFGQTLPMERQASGVANWPGQEVDTKFVNEDLRLYGGAQARSHALDVFARVAC